MRGMYVPLDQSSYFFNSANNLPSPFLLLRSTLPFSSNPIKALILLISLLVKSPAGTPRFCIADEIGTEGSF